VSSKPRCEAEFEVLGVPFKERGAITDEYLRAIEVLWTEVLWTDEIAEFAGTYVNFSNMVCDPRPVQKPGPPILIGGNSKAAMRRAARLGDGWHPWTVSPTDLPACIEYIYGQPELQNKPRPFEIVMPMARLNVDDVTHQELGVTRFPTTTEEVLDEIGTLRDLGSTGILTYFAPTSSLEEYLGRIAWFAEDIMPPFRN
jgi:hypothetical protein